jgi:hypothetical protein
MAMNDLARKIKTGVKLTLLSSLFLCTRALNAQVSPLPPEDLRVIMAVTLSDSTMQAGDTTFEANTALIGKAFIALTDTIGIYKVHIRLAASDSTANLMSKVFVFASTGNFADGTSFNRTGNLIEIGLGNFMGLTSYYAEAKIEDSQNQFSSIIQFYNKPEN